MRIHFPSVQRFAVPLFIVGLWVLAAGTAAAFKPLSNVTFDEDVDPFYQDQTRVLLPRIKETIPRAYDQITRQWGITLHDGLAHPVTVQLKEIPSETLQRRVAAYVRPEGFGDNFHQTLVLDIGAYMQNAHEDVEIIITHEMSHVILHDIESVNPGMRIPPWFDEGLAQSASAEGHKRVQSDIWGLHYTHAPLLLCDLDGPVDEFANGPSTLNSGCYPEYFLAVQRLRQMGGPHTFRTVIERLRAGEGMHPIVQSLTGMDWPSYKKEVEDYAGKVFSGSKPIP